METRSEPRSPSSKVRSIAATLRITEWFSCWFQLALALASFFALGFAVTGSNFTQETTAGIGIGIFLAACGILILLFNVFLAFRCTRIAKRLSHPDPSRHPRKADVMQVLRLGVIMGLIGMLLMILGGGASLGVLLAKSFARPQGTVIYDPRQMMRALDVLVAMANMNGITGHFVGIVSALGLLDRLHRS